MAIRLNLIYRIRAGPKAWSSINSFEIQAIQLAHSVYVPIHAVHIFHVPFHSSFHGFVHVPFHSSFRGFFHIPVSGSVHVPVPGTFHVPVPGAIHVPVPGSVHVPVSRSVHVPGYVQIPVSGSIHGPVPGSVHIPVPRSVQVIQATSGSVLRSGPEENYAAYVENMKSLKFFVNNMKHLLLISNI